MPCGYGDRGEAVDHEKTTYVWQSFRHFCEASVAYTDRSSSDFFTLQSEAVAAVTSLLYLAAVSQSKAAMGN